MDCSPPNPLSMEFSRQEYWSRWPFPSPGDLPYPGIESRSPALQADSLPSELPISRCTYYKLFLACFQFIGTWVWYKCWLCIFQSSRMPQEALFCVALTGISCFVSHRTSFILHHCCCCLVSKCIQLFVIPGTVACQAPLSAEFSRQKYWSGLPFPSPGHLPHPGIEPKSPASWGGFFTTEPSECQCCTLSSSCPFCLFFCPTMQHVGFQFPGTEPMPWSVLEVQSLTHQPLEKSLQLFLIVCIS